VLPDLSTATVFGANGHTVLRAGLVVCALGLAFGVMAFRQLRALLDSDTRRSPQ
jgi:K(+)-stimulated pyrophosphate-energized sodium pump